MSEFRRWFDQNMDFTDLSQKPKNIPAQPSFKLCYRIFGIPVLGLGGFNFAFLP